MTGLLPINFGEVIAELGEEEKDRNGKLKLAFSEIQSIFNKYMRGQ